MPAKFTTPPWLRKLGGGAHLYFLMQTLRLPSSAGDTHRILSATFLIILGLSVACDSQPHISQHAPDSKITTQPVQHDTETSDPQPHSSRNVLAPKITTQPVQHDTDDPAIWINEDSPKDSLILGTDKHRDGALYVYDLNGNIIENKVVRGLKRPNNVDVETFTFTHGDTIGIAATTERLTNKLRIFSVPAMVPADNGGIDVFVGEEERSPMGVALYKRESDNAVFAVVSRKSGPSEGYLWQYRLTGNPDGTIAGHKVRAFGAFSGKKEIEAIAADSEHGYLYYSDETFGVRKYHADPDMGDTELAVFATSGFTHDQEGISIYKSNDGSGYILVSDQQANAFHVFNRIGEEDNPHHHQLITVVHLSTIESDGSDVTNASLGPLFPRGLFVAMSDDRTFQLYAWEDLAGDDLVITPNGVPEGSSPQGE